MPETLDDRRSPAFAVWLIVAGVIGWWAAFSLTMEKFEKALDPGAAAGCDFSILYQCSANLQSWQGSVFGFPNPIIGLACWIAPIVVGVATLAGARFARWFWVLFWGGFLFAFGFVAWLISQSIYELGTLCPWCMVTWSVTIPSLYAVTLHLLRIGVLPISERARERADGLMAWVPLAAFLSYVLVLLLAQFQLDAIPNLWHSLFG